MHLMLFVTTQETVKKYKLLPFLGVTCIVQSELSKELPQKLGVTYERAKLTAEIISVKRQHGQLS